MDNALRIVINQNSEICKEQIQLLMQSNEPVFKADDIHIPEVDLSCYDQLLEEVMPC